MVVHSSCSGEERFLYSPPHFGLTLAFVGSHDACALAARLCPVRRRALHEPPNGGIFPARSWCVGSRSFCMNRLKHWSRFKMAGYKNPISPTARRVKRTIPWNCAHADRTQADCQDRRGSDRISKPVNTDSAKKRANPSASAVWKRARKLFRASMHRNAMNALKKHTATKICKRACF